MINLQRRRISVLAAALLSASSAARAQENAAARSAESVAVLRVSPALSAPVLAPSALTGPSLAALAAPLTPAPAAAPAAAVPAAPAAVAPEAGAALAPSFAALADETFSAARVDGSAARADAATAARAPRSTAAELASVLPDEPLEALFDGARRPNAGGSRIALLAHPGESFAARAQMLSSARRTIDAGYFHFVPDETGLTKLALLRAAARSGRRVRLLLDPFGNELSKAMLRHLIDEGVEVRIYHPMTLQHLSWFWRRSHDKWTIVDGEEMIVGDSNMADPYFGRGAAPWRSREAYVSGKAARQGRAYVDEIWNGREARAPRGLDKVSAAEIADAARLVDAHEPADASAAARPWAERAHATDVRFVRNGLRRPHVRGGIGTDLLELIRSAKSTIVIENAYVSLPKVFLAELERAIRERGVRVVVITNSRASNNQRLAAHAYEFDAPALVRIGAEVYEFDGPGTLHAKGLVVDGRRAYIGSFNLNPWSFLFNTETGVIADDHPAFARDLLERMEQTRRMSTPIARGGVWLTNRAGRARMRRRFLFVALLRRLVLGV